MSEKNEFSIGGVILLIFIVAAILYSVQDPPTPQSPASPEEETWRQYAIVPEKEDVLAQLSNSQKLIIALGNDLSRLQAQNVDIKYALQTVNAQLARIQQQAAEDAKRQTRENWMFAAVGIVGGWLVNFIFPTSNLSDFVSGLRDKRSSNNQKKIKTDDVSAGREVKSNLSSVSHSGNVNNDLVSPTNSYAGLCPKCGRPMKISPATLGEHKGSLFYVCFDCQETILYT